MVSEANGLPGLHKHVANSGLFSLYFVMGLTVMTLFHSRAWWALIFRSRFMVRSHDSNSSARHPNWSAIVGKVSIGVSKNWTFGCYCAGKSGLVSFLG